MATTLQNKFETIVNDAVETANANFGPAIEDARTTARKAMLANLGLFALAYDNVKSLTKNFDSFVDDAGERAASLFEEAVERGEKVEGVALDRTEQIRSEAKEHFDSIELRIKETLGRSETVVMEEVPVTENVVEMAVEAKEAVVEVVEEVIEVVAAPFEGYANLTARDVLGQLEEMTSEQLAAVKAYEEANANRVTIIRDIDRRLAG
ncbi:MAG: hypothetical protein ACPG8W_05375 [Candidatus Promineifilaceae bacterium]